MNTDTTNNGETGSAKSAFGDKGTNVNAMNYGHPYAEQIIEGAKEVLRESETGRILVGGQESCNVPIHVLKGASEAGYSPEMNTIFLYAPGNLNKASATIVFDLIKGTREADLEFAGQKKPDPMEDLMEYAAFMHSRNLDTIMHICKVVKELTNSSYYSVLIDKLTELGFNEFNKAYIEGKSRNELYDYYAEAYETRGV